MDTIKNKTYLVTGATSGIGKSVAMVFCSLGAKVFLVGRNHEVLSNFRLMYPDQCSYIEYDLSDAENIHTIMLKAHKEGYVFDGMVYCAGVSPLLPLSNYSYTEAVNVYNVNLFSFIGLLSYFTDRAYTNEGSHIVAISSSTAVTGGNRQFIYSSSKAALNLVIKSVVKELSLSGIRINAIMPSITQTEMVEKLRAQSDALDLNIKYKQPYGIIKPEEVSDLVVFLLSNESKAMSGVIVPLNNGDIY